MTEEPVMMPVDKKLTGGGQQKPVPLESSVVKAMFLDRKF